MTDTVLGNQSVVQIIWNSHVFKEWFQQFCKDVETTGQGNNVKHLKASKHRFESYQKPLGGQDNVAVGRASQCRTTAHVGNDGRR